MTRICPQCGHVARDYDYSVSPEEGRSKFKRSLLGAGTLIGTGIVMFFDVWEIYPYFFKILSILFILLGIYISKLYFTKVSKVCPKCNFDNMPASYEPEGQKVIQEKQYNIKDDSTHICTNCNIKSEHKVQSRFYSIFVTLFGLFTLTLSTTGNPIGIIGSLIIIGTGIYGLSTSLKKGFKCPHCNNNTAIAKDSPEAKALLEQST